MEAQVVSKFFAIILLIFAWHSKAFAKRRLPSLQYPSIDQHLHILFAVRRLCAKFLGLCARCEQQQPSACLHLSDFGISRDSATSYNGGHLSHTTTTPGTSRQVNRPRVRRGRWEDIIVTNPQHTTGTSCLYVYYQYYSMKSRIIRTGCYDNCSDRANSSSIKVFRCGDDGDGAGNTGRR